MVEQVQSSITFEEVTTKEKLWSPPEKAVEVVLVPKEGEEEYYPPSGPSPIDVVTPFAEKACLVNIESTGLMPFDSRLISIAAVDIRTPENIVHFTSQDEQKVLTDFFAWYELNGFEKLIGYNVTFDYRFIFTKAMKHRMNAARFYESDLSDVMQMMQQVKEAFVFGYNRPGKLDEWTEYYFGISGLLSYQEVLEAWRKKDLDKIASHNMKKVEQCLLLYALTLLTRGEMHAGQG